MVPIDELLQLVPAALLKKLALVYRVDRANQVRLSGETVFVCLLNTLANHALVTQRLLRETFERLTGKSVHYSSFSYRLGTICPDYFDAIFTHLYRQVQGQLSSATGPVLRQRIADATTVTLSSKLIAFGIRVASKAGRGRATYDRRHVKSVLELSPEGLPRFLRLCEKQAEANDNPALGDPMIEQSTPGDLWTFDSGCFDRDRLLSLHQKGAFFLTPEHGQRLRTLRVLWKAPPVAKETAGAAVASESAVPRKAREPAPYRLLRVELALFENSNDAVSPSRRHKWAQMPLIVVYGERFDLRTQQWKPLVLLTNLPLCESAAGLLAGPYTFLEVAELYRLRWRIEVFFKFLKQHLSYSHLTSRNENGIQVMIRMALIAALLLVWYRHRTGIDRGWRSVKFWFAEDAREWTVQLLRRDLTGCLTAAT